MKIKFLLMILISALYSVPSQAKYDDEKFCMMFGYAFEINDDQFYASLLLDILVRRGIAWQPDCVTAQTLGKSYSLQLKSAITKNGFDPSKISSETGQLSDTYAQFRKRINESILKNAGYLD